jgi:thiol-disulfide isomerase/thioredoxin
MMEENNTCVDISNAKKVSPKKPINTVLIVMGLVVALALGYLFRDLYGVPGFLKVASVKSDVELTKDQPVPGAANTGISDSNPVSPATPLVTESALTPQAVAKLTVDYINNNFDATKKTTLNKIFDDKISLYKFNVNYNSQVVPTYVSTDGKLFFTSNPVDMTAAPAASSNNNNTSAAPAGTITRGNFTQVNDASVCTENGKPIVYFFGSSTCPHCQWEKPVIEAVAKSFGNAISFHENIDSSADQAVFTIYDSSGAVPAVVLGCKYYRVGSGEGSGSAVETADLTKLICDLTGNQPGSVCNN